MLKRCLDGGYAGKLLDWVLEYCNYELVIVKHSPEQKGFHVLPKRWIVERTFGWLGKYRRLSNDYEFLTETSEAMIRVAMTRLMVKRLANDELWVQ